MSNRFITDSSALSKSDLEKDADSFTFESKKVVQNQPPTGHSKLPDLTDIQKLFKKADEDQSSNKHSSNIDTKRDGGKDTVRQNVLVNDSSSGKKNENEKKESLENSPKGREIILFLDQVLCDPKDNFSRGGKPYLESDYEVQNIAHLIKTQGLINPVEVSELEDPIEREEPTEFAKFYTHKVTSGFKRYAGLRSLGFDAYRFTTFDNISDDDKLIHNGIENFGRTDPTDYDLAQYIALIHRKKGWSAQRIAVQISGKIGKVESLLLIATRLPPELLEVFRVQPTPEVRRDLSKISLIERDTVDETHKAMMAEWIRLQNEKSQSEQRGQSNPVSRNSKPSSGSRNNSNPNANKMRLAELRNEQATASQWFDSLNNTFKPITEEMREYGDMIFRHLSDRKLRSPFR